MKRKKSLPQLAVSLADECNYKCYYCRPSGSSVSKCKKRLPSKEIVRLLSIAYQKGFRVFRITGGEPMLHPDIMKIIDAIANFGDDATILLGTNGVFLGKHLGNFKEYTNLKFFIGLDSINKNKEGFPKILTTGLLDNLGELSKTHYVRINMLVLNSNIEEVQNVIDFCTSLKIDLKLHDLYYCETILDPINDPEEFFNKEYYNITQLIPYLSKNAKSISKYPENASDCGIPMISFNINGINVIVKDSLKGSFYNSSCRSCGIYPCLHGLYCPIIASDGTLQPSNCINRDFHRLIAYQEDSVVEKAFDSILSVINKSKYETIRDSALNVDEKAQSIDLVDKVLDKNSGHCSVRGCSPENVAAVE